LAGLLDGWMVGWLWYAGVDQKHGNVILDGSQRLGVRVHGNEQCCAGHGLVVQRRAGGPHHRRGSLLGDHFCASQNLRQVFDRAAGRAGDDNVDRPLRFRVDRADIYLA